MTANKKVSVLPIYLVGAVWLGYALAFPLYAPLHYILCAGLSAAAFVLGKALFPNKFDPPASAAKEEEAKPGAQKEEKEDPEIAALRREKDRALSELRRLNDAIPDPKISDQIDHLEEVTGEIIGLVMEKPEKQPQIRSTWTFSFSIRISSPNFTAPREVYR